MSMEMEEFNAVENHNEELEQDAEACWEFICDYEDAGWKMLHRMYGANKSLFIELLDCIKDTSEDTREDWEEYRKRKYEERNQPDDLERED